MERQQDGTQQLMIWNHAAFYNPWNNRQYHLGTPAKDNNRVCITRHKYFDVWHVSGFSFMRHSGVIGQPGWSVCVRSSNCPRASALWNRPVDGLPGVSRPELNSATRATANLPCDGCGVPSVRLRADELPLPTGGLEAWSSQPNIRMDAGRSDTKAARKIIYRMTRKKRSELYVYISDELLVIACMA